MNKTHKTFGLNELFNRLHGSLNSNGFFVIDWAEWLLKSEQKKQILFSAGDFALWVILKMYGIHQVSIVFPFAKFFS